MAHLIRPEVRSSSANLRPCIVCRATRGLFVPAERRCAVMLSAPLPRELHGSPRLARCPNGLCPEHDTEVTIDGTTYPHICPPCLLRVSVAAGLVRPEPVARA